MSQFEHKRTQVCSLCQELFQNLILLLVGLWMSFLWTSLSESSDFKSFMSFIFEVLQSWLQSKSPIVVGAATKQSKSTVTYLLGGVQKMIDPSPCFVGPKPGLNEDDFNLLKGQSHLEKKKQLNKRWNISKLIVKYF